MKKILKNKIIILTALTFAAMPWCHASEPTTQSWWNRFVKESETIAKNPQLLFNRARQQDSFDDEQTRNKLITFLATNETYRGNRKKQKEYLDGEFPGISKRRKLSLLKLVAEEELKPVIGKPYNVKHGEAPLYPQGI